MAILGKIRSKGVLLMLVVGFALFAFIIGDALTQGSTFFNKSKETVAEIAGEKININDYAAMIDQMVEVYKIETGQTDLSEEITSQLRASVWENLVNEKLLNEEAEKILRELKQKKTKKAVSKKSPFDFPNRLWESLVLASGIDIETKWADLSKVQLQNLANQLTNSVFQVNGKSTFKEEFVTAGGIDLKEINFKTMQSKLHENLYFAGEIVNIDAITGGFNFQNAWTSGFILAQSI